MCKSQKLAQVLLAFYLIILVWILLFKFSISFSDVLDQLNNQPRNINFIPFKESVILNQKINLSEIVYNSLIFVPFGGLLGIVDKKSSLLKRMFFFFLFSLAIEVSQFILGLGATDITDIITNVSGGLIGLFIYKLLDKIFNTEKLDTILAIGGTILFVGACLLLLLLLLVN